MTQNTDDDDLNRNLEYTLKGFAASLLFSLDQADLDFMICTVASMFECSVSHD